MLQSFKAAGWRVIELVADKSGWANKKSSHGHAWGIAAHKSFNSYVASVVEVEVDSKGQLRIPRVDIAVDAGMVINPDRVKSQFEGAAVFGTSIVRSGAITAKNGVIEQSNFNDYPVARMNEAPYETTVHIVDGKGIEQVWVPAGSFLMGTDDADIEALKSQAPPSWVAKGAALCSMPWSTGRIERNPVPASRP
jgi:CO/xanthine dehydrogenase Mo-binding subunit